MKGTVIALGCVFLAGSCLGSQMTETKVDFVEVERTKVIREKAPPPVTKTVYEVPESCLLANQLAADITLGANELYNAGEEQLNIMSAGRVAVWAREGFAEVENRQRDLQSDTIGALAATQENLAALNRARAKCEEDVE